MSVNTSQNPPKTVPGDLRSSLDLRPDRPDFSPDQKDWSPDQKDRSPGQKDRSPDQKDRRPGPQGLEAQTALLGMFLVARGSDENKHLKTNPK